MLKQQLDKDLKAALLAGDKDRATIIRGLKSAILYVEVAKGAREEGLSDEEVIILLSKESKKRQESADLYIKGGAEAKAAAELNEKAIIDAYLPAQLSDEQLVAMINEIVATLDVVDGQAMGQVIGKVKEKAAGAAEGGRIAKLVRERLQQ